MTQNPFSSAKRAWKIYLTAIEGFFEDSGANLTIQPLAVAKQADWDYSNVPGFNTFKQWSIVNQILPWAGFGTEMGKSFENQWELFLYKCLSNIKSIEDKITPEDIAKINDYDRRRDSAFREQKIRKGRLEKAWEEYIKNTPKNAPDRKSKPEFFRDDPDFSRVQELDFEIKSNNAHVKQIRLKYADLSYIEINKAIDFWNSTDGKFRLPERKEDEGIEENYSTFSKQFIDGDIFRFKSETNTRSYTFEETSIESSSSESIWGGSLGIDFGFWGFSAGASGSALDRMCQTDITKLEISFSNVQEFPVRRGRWFDISLIEKYGESLIEFWGVSGSMNVIPISIILVRGSKIKITANESFVHEFEKHINGSGGVRIGPFKIGGGGGSTERRYSYLFDGSTMEIKDESGLPDVVAFKCYQPFLKESERGFVSPELFNSLTKI
jgi:hypothetical protein